MKLTRRQTLLGLSTAATAVALGACSRGTANLGSSGESGDAQLQLSWWGNEVRDAQTQDVVALYLDENPGVAIETMPAEFSAYFDRLATQTAAGDMPDIIQMGDGFLAEYGTRGALLDLEPYLDTSKFAPGTVDVGRVDGVLQGINAGINTPTLMCNVAVFEAAGVPIPDDTSWTWDDYLDVAAAITAASGGGIYGTGTPGAEGVLRAWIRQHGEELFTTDGELGVSVDTLHGYFDLLSRCAATSAMAPASTLVEDAGKSIEESPLVTGTNGLQLVWTNQFTVVSQSADADIQMLRLPSVTGIEADLQAWYHPSMLWCVAQDTANPDAAGAFVNWWVNSIDCGKIVLDERGRPCNTEVLAAIEGDLSPQGQAVSQFLADLEPALGEPQPVPPPGSGSVLGDILSRSQEDLYFGRIDSAAAASQFHDEALAALAG